jgi:hypothetical protein
VWNSFAALIFNRGNICFMYCMRGKWLRSRSQTLLRGSTVVGFPFQETGAECIVMSQCQGLCMLKQDGKIHQPKRDKECTRTSWLTGRLNGVG